MAQGLNYKSFIWGIAEKLRGPYRRSDNGKVILPFTVLRRLDCVLEGTKDEVLKAAAATEEGNVARDFQLQKIAGYSFYNTSPYDLRKAVGDPANLKQNLQAYVAGFSPNVRDVFDRYAFDTHLENLDEADLLLLVTQEFLKVDLHPEAVDNATMGHIFEHLIGKAMEASNEESGDYFTPRDVVRLMVNLLFARDDEVLSIPGVVRSIYDPTAGTGGMLSVAEDHIRQLNPNAQLTLYGQEFNKESYAIAKTDLLIKGQSAENMVFGDTLTDDGHWDKTFDYGLANPPFGVDWAKQREFVTREHAQRGFGGRFGAGLPRVSDGSLLFLMHLVSKMRPVKEGGGRIGIVLNGSPLFTGAAGSGESEIRRWVLENDLVEAIIALPSDMFYNTGIATYIWLIDNDKPHERRGKVQLVDATKKFTKMAKNVGKKRNEISSRDIDEIVRLYDAFEESEDSKIFDTKDFGYTTVTIERPLRQNWAVTPSRITRALENKTLQKLGLQKLESLREVLQHLASQEYEATTNSKEFTALLKESMVPLQLNPSQLRALIGGLAERDDAAPVQTNAQGGPVPDADLRDTENVPLGWDIDKYIDAEIAPHLDYFWADRSKDKIGYEIPFTRHFYRRTSPNRLDAINTELNRVLEEVTLRFKVEDAFGGGLQGSVPTRESGHPWVGSIPAHWKSASLRWLAKIYSGGTPDRANPDYWKDGTLPWLNSGSVNAWSISEPSELISEAGFASSSARWVPPGSVVIALAGQGRTKGMAARLEIRATTNQSMAAIVPGAALHYRFLHHWLSANYQSIRNLAGGDKRDGLNLEHISSIVIPLPPLAEQVDIADYLDREAAKMDNLSSQLLELPRILAERMHTLGSLYCLGQGTFEGNHGSA